MLLMVGSLFLKVTVTVLSAQIKTSVPVGIRIRYVCPAVIDRA